MELGQETTISDVLEETWRVVPELMVSALDDIKKGKFKTEPQGDEEAIYSYPRLPRDGEIDWSRPASEIDRLVRAVTHPYPGAFTFHEGRKLFIWKARVMESAHKWVGVPGHVVLIGDEVGVLTGEGILTLVECQFEGEEEITPSSYFTKRRMRLGLDVSDEIMRLRNELAQIKSMLKKK
jgi:methionyl-tRNA formyltransferase